MGEKSMGENFVKNMGEKSMKKRNGWKFCKKNMGDKNFVKT